MSEPRFAGQTAIVTGAGSGLGRGSAIRLGSEGASVVAADIHFDAAQHTAETIRQAGGTAIAVAVDVADPSSVTSLVAAALDFSSQIDILVNSAGVSGAGDPALEESTESLQQVLGVNLIGMFSLCQGVGRHMAERGRGSIINISSISAEVADPVGISYSISKGGVKNLTKSFAVALASSGVRVNAVGPGLAHSGMTAGLMEDAEQVRLRLAKVPLGRFAQPSDVAGAVAFLASDDASYITGTTIYVDGGHLALNLYDFDVAR